VRALLCHYCRHHLEPEDDEALLGVVRNHLIQEHPAILPTDEQVSEIVATHAYYYLEYLPVHVGGTAFEEEEFGPDPY
jgi:hypothetical protein